MQRQISFSEEPGVPPSEDNMITLGKSKFGSSYLTQQKLGEWGHHMCLRGNIRNWNPKKIANGIELAVMSISNIQSVLRALNKASETVHFSVPDNFSDFELFNLQEFLSMPLPGIKIEPSFINPFSKDDLLLKYKSRQDSGIHRTIFTEGEQQE